MNLSRRDLLKLGAGAAALVATGVRPAGLRAAQPKKKIPIGLQLYSVRNVAAKDPPGTLEAIAKMGYEGVEFAGYYDLKAEDLRKILDKNGLRCCGTHLPLDAITGDALKSTVEFNKVLGNKYLIVAMLPPANMASLAALIDTAKLLTDVAGQVKESGMRVGYHAHPQDFTPVADRIPWDVIFSNAGPDVCMQLDVGHCLKEGGDPVAILKKFPHRSATIHLKEFGGPKGAVIGEGTAPWKEIFEVCETTGDTEWYIAEQEVYRTSPMESVQLCLKNLRKMGK
jgi:sugar phosphate isomerase/epimerase